MRERFDVVVVGGGPVGSLSALAFAARGFRTALVEARPAMPARSDGRVFALAAGSVALLRALGVWPRLAAASAPIRRVRVSAEGVFGALRLDAADLGQAALGAAVPAEALGSALEASLASAPVRMLRPLALVGLAAGSEALALELSGPEGTMELAARLVIGADGVDSAVRRLAGIESRPCGAPDRLLLASLGSERAVHDTAHLRFAREGAAALVPTGWGRFAGILSLGEGDELPLPGEEPMRAFQARIGWRLGRLRLLSPPCVHAVAPRQAERLVAARTVLIGQAALSLHPLAAQGLNLALRDLASLVEALAGSEDPGSASALATYESGRHRDHRRTLGIVEGLRRWFAPAPASAPLSALGMLLCDRLAPLRRALAAWGSGLRPPVPALLRGAWP